MQIEKQGSVRADLVGGTLDLHPINLILPQVYTINIALGLKAKICFSKHEEKYLKIISHDYQQEYKFSVDQCLYDEIAKGSFSKMSLLMRILLYWKPSVEKLKGLQIELSSGAPAGSGLGGSSAMAITFMQVVRDYLQLELTDEELLQFVMYQEAIDLDCGPTGYQDYYPALYGGVLALEATGQGVITHQCYDEQLKHVLENCLTLVYSGQSRFSAINNWEVYKAFFDKDKQVRVGLSKLAELSKEAYKSLQEKKYSEFVLLIKEEGSLRRLLFKDIETTEMTTLLRELKQVDTSIALKVCGAGGGGCFLLIHPEISRSALKSIIIKHQMQILDFEVSNPK